MRRILITGGTGALGARVVADLRVRNPSDEIVVLSRSGRRADGNVRYVCADLCSDIEALGECVAGAAAVLHMAADIRWGAPLAEAWTTNVTATERLCALVAGRAPAAKFIFMSTSYTATPDRDVAFGSDTTANSYETTKRAAEAAVQRSGLRWQILRPSLIVGDSVTGAISRLNGIYPFIRLVAAAAAPVMPGREEAHMDIVPVDYVSAATLEALERDDAGGIWKLVSGDLGIPLGELVDIVVDTISRFRTAHDLPGVPRPQFVDTERYRRFFAPFIRQELRPGARKMLEVLDLYLPYVCVSEPFRPEASEIPRLGRPPAPRDFMGMIVDTWCRENATQALTAPRDWSASLKPQAPPARADSHADA